MRGARAKPGCISFGELTLMCDLRELIKVGSQWSGVMHFHLVFCKLTGCETARPDVQKPVLDRPKLQNRGGCADTTRKLDALAPDACGVVLEKRSAVCEASKSPRELSSHTSMHICAQCLFHRGDASPGSPQRFPVLSLKPSRLSRNRESKASKSQPAVESSKPPTNSISAVPATAWRAACFKKKPMDFKDRRAGVG